VLVLDTLVFCTEKRGPISLQLFCSVGLIVDNRILEDEDDDEHENDFSASEFRIKKEVTGQVLSGHQFYLRRNIVKGCQPFR